MPNVKRYGRGITIDCQRPSESSPVVLGLVTQSDIDGPEIEYAEVDTTLYGDAFKNSIPGTGDAKQIKVELAFSPESDTYTRLRTIRNAEDVCIWGVTYPAKGGNPAVTLELDGWIQILGHKHPKDGMITCELTIRACSDFTVRA